MESGTRNVDPGKWTVELEVKFEEEVEVEVKMESGKGKVGSAKWKVERGKSKV